MKSWEEMGAADDDVFSCDVSPVNRPLNLRLGLLGWVTRWETVRGKYMNDGFWLWPSPTVAASWSKIWWAKSTSELVL